MHIRSLFSLAILCCKISFCQKADSTDHFLRYINFGMGLVNLNGIVTLEDVKNSNLNSKIFQKNLEPYTQERTTHSHMFIHWGYGLELAIKSKKNTFLVQN